MCEHVIPNADGGCVQILKNQIPSIADIREERRSSFKIGLILEFRNVMDVISGKSSDVVIRDNVDVNRMIRLDRNTHHFWHKIVPYLEKMAGCDFDGWHDLYSVGACSSPSGRPLRSRFIPPNSCTSSRNVFTES